LHLLGPEDRHEYISVHYESITVGHAGNEVAPPPLGRRTARKRPNFFNFSNGKTGDNNYRHNAVKFLTGNFIPHDKLLGGARGEKFRSH
jgi:hypothetical protein